MNGFILMLPLFFIRFVLLGWLNSTALKRGAHFAPMTGAQKIMYVLYQMTNVVLILFPLFLRVHGSTPLLVLGGVTYVLGVGILLAASISFAKPNEQGLNTTGSYRFSRNPMYVGYFVYFLGCAILLGSFFYYGALVLFQIATHWVILAEERWCSATFGETYDEYQQQVRRYL